MKLFKILFKDIDRSKPDQFFIVLADTFSESERKMKQLRPLNEIISITICGETLMKPFRGRREKGDMPDVFALYNES